MSEQLRKGAAAEEMLRNYFLSLGYYVARGCKFVYHGFDVTDVDLFLYARSSPLSRERICVDIKNKKTPQALERIFWVKGVQSILQLDSSIVATTDTRPDVREFGLRHDVRVLDGTFLSRLNRSAKSHRIRITEEQFLSELDSGSLGRLGGNWCGRYTESKARLLQSLNFDGCNSWLEELRMLLSEIATGSNPWRLFYALCSHFLVAIDFIQRDFVGEDQTQRRKVIEQGIRYGSSGKEFADSVTQMASSLVESVAGQSGLSRTLQAEIQRQADGIGAEAIADFFSRQTNGLGPFEVALQFEEAAFSPEVPPPSTLSPQAKSVIGVVADFCGIDRKLAIP
ncbi:MAG: hypothetical protein IBJ03_10425 [Gemmatimonadaceae bacterium]|nr:hypothetical protein [Gemmatimonadaceae bacterium]